MRSTILVVAALAGSTVAHADAKADVEAVVRAQLGAIGSKSIADTLAKGATVWVQDHALAAGDSPATYESWLSGGNAGGGVSVAMGAPIVITVDDAARVAWFHGALTVKHKEDTGVKSIAVRALGVAVGEGGAWKIAAASYTTTMTDAALVAYAQDNDVEPATGAPKLEGDPAIAKAVAAWFPGGLVKGASAASKQLAANGTSAGELAATPAAAQKLAKTWDAAKIRAAKVMVAKAFGKLALVRVEARMPVPPAKPSPDADPDAAPKGPRAADLALFALVEDDGAAGWRWVALAWQP